MVTAAQLSVVLSAVAALMVLNRSSMMVRTPMSSVTDRTTFLQYSSSWGKVSKCCSAVKVSKGSSAVKVSKGSSAVKVVVQLRSVKVALQ